MRRLRCAGGGSTGRCAHEHRSVRRSPPPHRALHPVLVLMRQPGGHGSGDAADESIRCPRSGHCEAIQRPEQVLCQPGGHSPIRHLRNHLKCPPGGPLTKCLQHRRLSKGQSTRFARIPAIDPETAPTPLAYDQLGRPQSASGAQSRRGSHVAARHRRTARPLRSGRAVPPRRVRRPVPRAARAVGATNRRPSTQPRSRGSCRGGGRAVAPRRTAPRRTRGRSRSRARCR